MNALSKPVINTNRKPRLVLLAIAVAVLAGCWLLAPLMTSGPANLFLFLGIGGISVCYLQDRRWRRRLRHWRVVDGTITGTSSIGDCVYPVFSFHIDGRNETATSKIDHSRHTRPQSVKVVYDPETGEAELLTWFTHWFWIAFTLPLSLAFTLLALCSTLWGDG